MSDDIDIKDKAAWDAADRVADYEHGWSSDIETDFAPKGLTEDTVRFISAKKNEPEWMLEWRLKAFASWKTMTPPDWAKLNAYERTKLACQELTRAGAPIPAWTALRDIIRKGSAGDINRAKKDFRLEHAEALRKMEGFSADGVPPALTPHILGMWTEAIKNFAEYGKGNVIFLDGSPEGMNRTLEQVMGMEQLKRKD